MGDRETVAYHEAGHAVTRIALGGRVHHIDLEVGWMQTVPEPRPVCHAMAEYAGGPIAEAIHAGKTAQYFSARWWLSGGHSDNRAARIILANEGLGEPEIDGMLAAIVSDVFAFLSDGAVWGAVRAVATMALVDDSLGGDAINAIWISQQGIAAPVDALSLALARRGEMDFDG